MNPLPLLVIVLVLSVVGWAKWLDWHTARHNPSWTFGKHPPEGVRPADGP